MMTSEILGRCKLSECTTPKKKKTTPPNQLLFRETFQLLYRSSKTLLKSSNYLGFGTITPPHRFQQTLLNARVFSFFCPEMSFFPSSCSGDGEWEKNALLSRKKFPLCWKLSFYQIWMWRHNLRSQVCSSHPIPSHPIPSHPIPSHPIPCSPGGEGTKGTPQA